jgi:stage V sporulation protein B
MIIILIGRGLPISMSKYLGETNKNKTNNFFKIKKNAFFLQMVVVILVTSIYFFLAPIFAKILKDPSLTTLFQISSLIIPGFALASFYSYYFTGIQEFGKKSFLKFFRSITKIFFIVGLGYYFKVTGALIGQALAPFSVYLLGYVLDPFTKAKCRKKASFQNPPLEKKLIKKMAHFAWPIVLFMLFYEFMISLNLYFVKAMLQDDALTGVYNAAITVSRIPYYLFFFMTVILLPKISESTSQGIKKETQNLLQKSFRYLFIGLFPTVTVLHLFSDSAISFFYGNGYSSGGPIMSVLIFGFGFLTVFYVLTFVLNGAGLNKFPMYISITGALLNAGLNYILIKQLGLAGSALATTITSALILLITLVYSNRKIIKFVNVFLLAKCLVASLVIYQAGLLLTQGKYIFIVWSTLLIILYLFLLIFFREINKKDLIYLKQFFNKSK